MYGTNICLKINFLLCEKHSQFLQIVSGPRQTLFLTQRNTPYIFVSIACSIARGRSKFLKSTVNFHSASGRRGFSWEPSREVCIGGYTCRKTGGGCRATATHLRRFRARVTGAVRPGSALDFVRWSLLLWSRRGGSVKLAKTSKRKYMRSPEDYLPCCSRPSFPRRIRRLSLYCSSFFIRASRSPRRWLLFHPPRY